MLLWDEYLKLTGQSGEEPAESDIVYRDGKPYKETNAKDADWAKSAF